MMSGGRARRTGIGACLEGDEGDEDDVVRGQFPFVEGAGKEEIEVWRMGEGWVRVSVGWDMTPSSKERKGEVDGRDGLKGCQLVEGWMGMPG